MRIFLFLLFFCIRGLDAAVPRSGGRRGTVAPFGFAATQMQVGPGTDTQMPKRPCLHDRGIYASVNVCCLMIASTPGFGSF